MHYWKYFCIQQSQSSSASGEEFPLPSLGSKSEDSMFSQNLIQRFCMKKWSTQKEIKGAFWRNPKHAGLWELQRGKREEPCIFRIIFFCRAHSSRRVCIEAHWQHASAAFLSHAWMPDIKEGAHAARRGGRERARRGGCYWRCPGEWRTHKNPPALLAILMQERTAATSTTPGRCKSCLPPLLYMQFGGFLQTGASSSAMIWASALSPTSWWNSLMLLKRRIKKRHKHPNEKLWIFAPRKAGKFPWLEIARVNKLPQKET